MNMLAISLDLKLMVQTVSAVVKRLVWLHSFNWTNFGCPLKKVFGAQNIAKEITGNLDTDKTLSVLKYIFVHTVHGWVCLKERGVVRFWRLHH